MSEPLPPSPEKTVIVTTPSLGRLWTLTITSLVLNSFILLFLLVAITHGHPKDRRSDDRPDRGGPRGCPGMAAWRGGPPPDFCRYRGGFGPGPRWGGPGGMGFRGGDCGGQCPMGMGGGPRGFGGSPGLPGMKGNGPQEPPDPAKITDGILRFLTNTLTLSDDQKAKLKPIIADQVSQMQKQLDDTKAKIRPLLNADQQKQLDALPMPGAQPPPPPDASGA